MPCIHCQRPDHQELEGVPFHDGLPRACWLYANDPAYKALGDGQPIPDIKTIPAISKIGVAAMGESITVHPSFTGSVAVHANNVRPGPGSQLHGLFGELGLKGWEGCQCSSRARQMDSWGVEGCKTNRDTIIGWMREAREHLSWMEMLKAAKLLAFKVNPFDPLGSLLDEAIRRAAM